MKTRTTIFTIILLLSAIFLSACNKGFSGEWVAKIEGDTITIDELNSMYYAQHSHLLNLSNEEIKKYSADPEMVKRIPTLNKKIFLEELIKQRLIYNKAVTEGLLDKPEVRAIIQIAKEGAVVQSYVKEKFKDDVNITDEEIDEVYRKERDGRYKGVPISEAEKYIRQYLISMKLQTKLKELVDNLVEQSRIEKNTELLKKEEAADTEGKSEKGKEEKKTEKK